MAAAVGWATLLRAAQDGRPVSERGPLVGAALQLAGDIAPGVVGCSITVGGRDGWTTPHASRPVALALDLAQYEAGTGPCIEAASTGVPQQLDVIQADPRFAGFARAAETHGVESSLSLPLPGTRESSALNIYGDHVLTFDSGRAAAVADLLARLIAALSDRVAPEASTATGLAAAALERGAVVRRAVAARAAALGVSEQDAYLLFAEQSRRDQRSIVDLAVQERRGGPSGPAVSG